MKQTLYKSPSSGSKSIEIKYFFWFVIVTLLIVLISFVNKNLKVSAQDLSESTLLPNEYQNDKLNVIFLHQDKKSLLHPVTIITRDGRKAYLVYSFKVANILKELQLPTEKYKPVISAEESIKFPYEIALLELSSTIVTETEDIPASTKTIINEELEMGTDIVTQEGQNGKINTVKRLNFEDDKMVKADILKNEVISEMKPKIIEHGIKPHQISVDGVTINYTDSLDVKATMYDSYCSGCDGRGLTYTGNQLTKGVIAVDPTVIPLYTKVYIPGYGFAQALDIGGGIKGNIVDLGYKDFAADGVKPYTRHTTVYILSEQ